MKKDSTKNQTFNELAKQIRLRGPDWFRNPKIKDFDRALEKAGVNRIGAKDLTLRCMKCGKIWLPEFEKGQPMQEFWKCPLIIWLDGLPPKAQDKCIVRIERLSEMGHELRRPEADYLRNKIHELRVAFQSIQYRMLYFFSNKQCIITHGFIKEGNEVPPKEIDLAVTRKARFEENPMNHTYRR